MARYNSPYYEYLTMPPLHLCFFISVVFLLLGLSWYINYESMMEEKMDQFKLLFMICPLLLLLLVQFLSRHDQLKVPFNLRLPDQESIHRAGGTPWGVAALLVFLLIMVSHQASLRESWFPLLSK
uniref:Transmembrane protein n=1 Tax=Kalanchoe fedtschenkoi TaxID=63787 RepID=A0A7N0UFJ6_KALFE